MLVNSAYKFRMYPSVKQQELINKTKGISYGNPNYLKKYERKIKGLQKGLSRKIKGSNN